MMAPRWLPRLLSAPLLLLPGLAGCGDPAGPELSGTIALGPGVQVTSFKTLQVRVYPDPGGAFDANAIPGSAYAQTSAATGSFPHAYRVGDFLGTTANPNWRMVAWVSHHDDTAGTVLPESGDFLCTAVATLSGCGTYGGYCGDTSGVDCTLVHPLP